MKFLKTIFAVPAVAILGTLVACGGGSSNNNNNHQNNPISVSLGSPVNSMAEKATTSFTATVTNDSANAGVNWTVTCSATDCGSFASAQTASGTSNAYTAPATIPSGGVTIMATSVTDNTKNAAAAVAITIATTLADGNYVFSINGQDQNANGNFSAYNVAGAFTVAGGSITGGEQDLTDSATPTTSDLITAGSISSNNGLLVITLDTADTAIGVNGVETLSGTMVSGNRALINQFDAFGSASGELDLQIVATPAAGSYAFFVNGGDTPGNGCVMTVGGIMNLDGAGNVSVNGSVFDEDDCGNVLQNEQITAGTVSTSDSFGRTVITIVPADTSLLQMDYIAYPVDGNRVRLIEDDTDGSGITSGTAFAQGANAGTFSIGSVAGSTYVFGSKGGDFNGYYNVAGSITLNADGTVVGVVDAHDLTCSCTQLAVQGTYTVDATGRVTISGLADGGGNFGPTTLQMYLDGNGNGTTGLLDSNHLSGGYIYQQSGTFSASSFSGAYGFDATGVEATQLFELDAVGPVSADGVSAITGTIDLNLLGGAQGTAAVTDAFTADPSGVFTGTMTGLDVDTPTNTDSFSYYLVDSTRAFAIENDSNQLTLGYFELQQ